MKKTKIILLTCLVFLTNSCSQNNPEDYYRGYEIPSQNIS
jgi:hypothetical protein